MTRSKAAAARKVDADLRPLLDGMRCEVAAQCSFDGIVGAQSAKSSLRDVILFRRPAMRALRSRLDHASSSNILLYGPPGTGKTMLAKAMVTESQCKYLINVRASDVRSKWEGESERFIKNLFLYAQENMPCIVFID
ncbi:hypothetical protein OC842_007946, partial [Tilletia horrida]